MNKTVRPRAADEVIEEAKDIGLPLFERFPGLSIGLMLVATLVLFTIAVPGVRFVASPTNLANIMYDTSEILIMAVAMNLVIIAAGIDLSVGSTLVLSSVIAAKTMATFSGTPEDILAFEYPRAAVGIPVGIAFGIGTGALCGLINGLLIARARLPAFIVTLGTLGVYLGTALVITNGVNTPYVPPGLQRLIGASRIGGIIPVPVIIALIIAGIGWITLAYTKFGVYTYAIGSSAQAARLAGINVERHLVWLYTLAGLCAGIAGVVDVARFNTTSIGSHTSDNLASDCSSCLGRHKPLWRYWWNGGDDYRCVLPGHSQQRIHPTRPSAVLEADSYRRRAHLGSVSGYSSAGEIPSGVAHMDRSGTYGQAFSLIERSSSRNE